MGQIEKLRVDEDLLLLGFDCPVYETQTQMMMMIWENGFHVARPPGVVKISNAEAKTWQVIMHILHTGPFLVSLIKEFGIVSVINLGKVVRLDFFNLFQYSDNPPVWHFNLE